MCLVLKPQIAHAFVFDRIVKRVPFEVCDTSRYGRRTCLIHVSDLNLLQSYIARVPGVTGMKAHIHYFAIWFPLLVLLFLVLSFIALTMIAHPGARLPPFP
jgi:hypothetical protein